MAKFFFCVALAFSALLIAQIKNPDTIISVSMAGEPDTLD